MAKLENIHPGEILLEEFLIPLGISSYRLAKETHIPITRVLEIVKKRRKITTDTALRFSAFFGNSAEFWIGIQTEYELREEKEKLSAEIGKIHRYMKAVGV
ncbi:MAG: addiction module antidote protein, HigA family [Syntrophus sp. (in: bacteria)]|nr:addiction module antidote protein, HigA family [Syntrophus sp. (in: bacteria)]